MIILLSKMVKYILQISSNRATLRAPFFTEYFYSETYVKCSEIAENIDKLQIASTFINKGVN